MKQNALLLILALCFVISPALGQQEASEPLAASNVAANASEQTNSSIPSGDQFTMVNIFQIAEENPIDPKLGYMRKEVIFGKNASVNMTVYMPGINSGAHYHNATDEIDYVVKGQANLTMNGKDYPVKAGDLIYIPPFNVHDYRAAENDTFQIMVFFVPAFDGKDRVYV
jgi:quercetin dioxygenase-like cupin family protein